MNGNGEDGMANVNQDLIRKLEQVLREVKAGRWQAGGIVLAAANGAVVYHASSPNPAFSMFLSGCANGLIAEMNKVFQPQQPAIVPVQAFQFPKQ